MPKFVAELDRLKLHPHFNQSFEDLHSAKDNETNESRNYLEESIHSQVHENVIKKYFHDDEEEEVTEPKKSPLRISLSQNTPTKPSPIGTFKANSEGNILQSLSNTSGTADSIHTKITLVCFIHPRSGGNLGSKIIKQLETILTPLQVFDLTKINLSNVLKHCANVLPRLGWKICVGGGDGSIAWVLSELDKLSLKEYQPPLSIVPLGTGNDLSRVLGWGTGFSFATDSLTTMLKQVHHAKTVYLDRWYIDSSVESDNLKVFNNYFSVGFDAEVLLKFHQKRRNDPDKYTSRVKNLLTYGVETAKKVIPDPDNKLYKCTRLVCDGVDYTDHLKADKPVCLLILNIHSYAGGRQPWGQPRRNSNFSSQKPNDGLLEVIMASKRSMAMHFATGKIPSRLCQASNIQIFITGEDPIAVQVDGEPWLQPAESTITLGQRNSVPMLLGKTKSIFTSKKELIEPWDAPKYHSSPEFGFNGSVYNSHNISSNEFKSEERKQSLPTDATPGMHTRWDNHNLTKRTCSISKAPNLNALPE